MSSLSVEMCGMEFENPFTLSSAPPTAKIESIDKAFSLGWGGAILKTITPDILEMIEASQRYAAWKLNGVICGFKNIELLSHLTVKQWLDGIKYLKQKHPKKVQIASIMALVVKEKWQNLVNTLNNSEIDGFELNFSCPHGMPEKGIGMAIGTNPEISSKITNWVMKVAKKPVFVKLSPNVTNIVDIAKAVEKAGANGIVAINTIQSLIGIDLDTFEPKPNINGKSTFGSYSGISIIPIGLRCIAQIRQNSQLPIMGCGGISNWSDAVEYISVGADVVQVCTAVMANGYSIIESMKRGLLQYLESKGFDSPMAIKNKAIPNLSTHNTLNKQRKVCPFINDDVCVKCVKCVKCVTICNELEHSVLSLVNGYISVDKQSCVGCSLCSHICPKSAITMK